MTVAGPVADLLASAVGSDERVLASEARGRWSVGRHVPDAVVFPESEEQVAEILGRASEEEIGVVPAGAGGWLDGGGPVREARVVLSTARMDGVEEYVPGNLTLTARAGLRLDALDRLARENSQWLPLDPPGWRGGTLGAAVATGLPGPLDASFGRPRDQLLGLTLVTGDGRILRPGGRVVKNVAGYDLTRLATGSWGTLGVIVRATVRVFPVPEVERTLLWREAGARGLVPAARALATAPVIPGALELLAPDPEAPDGGGAVVALRALGSRENVEEQLRIFTDAAGRPPDETLDDESSQSWHGRRSAEEGGGEGEGRAGSGTLELRMALLPAALDDLLELSGRVAGVAGEAGARCVRRVHLTRGILRLAVRGLTAEEAAATPWPGLLTDLRRRLEARSGSLRVVRGPDALVRQLPARSEAGPEGRIVRGLEEAFDPAGVLSPGRGSR